MLFLTDIRNLKRTGAILFLFLALPVSAFSAGQSVWKTGLNVTSDMMKSHNKPKKLQFIGNVIAIQEGMKVESDDMTVLYDKKGEQIQKIIATGSVRITQTEQVITGDRAELFPGEDRAVVTGEVVVVRPESRIRCRKLQVFFKEAGGGLKYVIADGDVYIKGKTREIMGDHADFFPDEQKTVVTGHAVAIKGDDRIESEKLTIRYAEGTKEPREMNAEGDVHIIGKDRLVTSERADFYSSEKKVVASGNVKVVQEEMEVKSAKLEVFYGGRNEELQKAIATGNVEIIGENRFVSGDKAVQYPKEKKIIVSGNAVYRKDNEDIRGEKIIYFYDRDDIIIKGGSKKRAKILLVPEK
jgi:lipopolysaccharide transport protein LptA